MRRPSLPVVAGAVVVIAAVALGALPKGTVRSRFLTSPDGTHLATLAREGGEWVVTLERVGGRPKAVGPPIEVARKTVEPTLALTDGSLEVRDPRGVGRPVVVRLDPRAR